MFVYVFLCLFMWLPAVTSSDFIETWCYNWASINFWWWSVPDLNFKSFFPSPQHCRVGTVWHLLAFSIHLAAAFPETQRSDWRRQGNQSTTFGTDPADTGNRINLEIEVRILMHFWLSLDALADIMLSLNAI